jgi:hypothetical protein
MASARSAVSGGGLPPGGAPRRGLEAAQLASELKLRAERLARQSAEAADESKNSHDASFLPEGVTRQ